MRVLALSLLLVLLANSVVVQATNNTNDVVKVKDETVGMPIKVVSIETAPGPWYSPDEISGMQYDAIIVLGLRPQKLLSVNDISISVEFRDAIGADIQKPQFYLKTSQAKKYATFNTTLDYDYGQGKVFNVPADLEPAKYENHLVPGNTYYVAFKFPMNTTSCNDNEFDRISLKVSQNGLPAL